jgi:iron(II)-dependent oxidoreductase
LDGERVSAKISRGLVAVAEDVSQVVSRLVEWHRSARERTLELVADLDDAQLMGPRLRIVNPLRWEVGHVGWFHERWTLRHARGEPPIRADGDALWDSIAVPHDTRWDLPLPPMPQTLAYIEEVLARQIDRLTRREPTEAELYFHRLGIFHEDMHGEAFAYTRQTLAYPEPPLASTEPSVEAGPLPGDACVPGGTFWLGASALEEFVFDNEKWAHPVDVAPFRIARAAVTNEEFATFVAEGGYRRREFWSAAGWAWRESVGAEHPVYWRRVGGDSWERRVYDRWVPLEPHLPVIHVCWYEAEAYCRFARRRLPTEVEWEVAAAAEPTADGRSLASRKRRFPWGDDPPTPDRANLDGLRRGPIDVGALPAGDSAFGCRQMIGNVWEWTASDFGPYPGFVPDPYKEYSQPWFGDHKVLRGGCWATRGRLLRATWRNFYTPDRRDVFAGFRTCALD